MYSEKSVFLYIKPTIKRFLYYYFENPPNEPLKIPEKHNIYQLLEFLLKSKSRNYDELHNCKFR